MSSDKKNDEGNFLTTENGTPLITEEGSPLLTQGNVKSIAPTAIPEPITKTIMVRQSGHFVDQMLISDKDAPALIEENKDKLNRDLFKDFNEKNNVKIIKETLEVEEIGYQLSSTENKLVRAIRSLLHDKSDKNLHSERYYLGNYFPNGEIITVNFSGHVMAAPHLLIPRGDLYKAFLGGDKYGGKDKKDIDRHLRAFSQRYFLTIYKQHIEVNGKPKFNRMTEYRPLIRLKRLDKGLSEMEDKLLDYGIEYMNGESEYLISLNPTWVDQIKSKWVEYPYDLNSRLGKALGHWNKSSHAIDYLVNYLFQQRSTKHFVSEINEDLLFSKLQLVKYIKRRERKRAEDFLSEAITICKKINLLKKADKVIGAQGQPKWVFEINKDV